MITWATEDGWPYPDALDDWIDLSSEGDDDLLSVRLHAHLYDDLDPLELRVVSARFGLQGAPMRSMKELLVDTGLPRAELRVALGSGLAKLRAHLV